MNIFSKLGLVFILIGLTDNINIDSLRNFILVIIGAIMFFFLDYEDKKGAKSRK